MTVTIVIPCYDSEATLHATCESVRAQTCPDWRIIAVNDRSTDGTPHILRQIAAKDARFTVIEGPGAGASAARNAALAQVDTDFVAFLDADDLWEPTRLAALHGVFAARPEIDIAYSRYAFFNEVPGDNSTQSTVPRAPLGIPDLMRENAVGTMSNLMMLRSALTRTGPFREDISHGEDREWLVRAVARGATIAGIDETLLYYRTTPGGLSTDLERMHAGWRESVRTARDLDSLPPPRVLKSAEAVYLRYLARRALRLGMPPGVAAAYALRGVVRSPRGFFSDGARGPLTLGTALAGLIAPRTLRDALANR